MATNQSLLRFCRKTHLYFGLVIAPSLLFFAFTGAVQVLSLHEAAGSSYQPPPWLARLGQIHKKQTGVLVPKRPPSANSGPSTKESSPIASSEGQSARLASPPVSTAGSGNSQGPAASSLKLLPAVALGSPSQPTLASKQKQHLPLKLFFLVVSLGLVTSTLTGIYMAYKYERGKALVTSLLVLGIVLPLFLLRF